MFGIIVLLAVIVGIGYKAFDYMYRTNEYLAIIVFKMGMVIGLPCTVGIVAAFVLG